MEAFVTLGRVVGTMIMSLPTEGSAFGAGIMVLVPSLISGIKLLRYSPRPSQSPATLAYRVPCKKRSLATLRLPVGLGKIAGATGAGAGLILVLSTRKLSPITRFFWA